MKDSGIKQIVLRQIMAAMDEDATNNMGLRIKKKDDKKVKTPIKLSELSDIRKMLE